MPAAQTAAVSRPIGAGATRCCHANHDQWFGCSNRYAHWNRLTVNGTFADLRSPATVARVHVAAKGLRGPSILELKVAPSTSGTISGTLDLTPRTGRGPVEEPLLSSAPQRESARRQPLGMVAATGDDDDDTPLRPPQRHREDGDESSKNSCRWLVDLSRRHGVCSLQRSSRSRDLRAQQPECTWRLYGGPGCDRPRVYSSRCAACHLADCRAATKRRRWPAPTS